MQIQIDFVSLSLCSSGFRRQTGKQRGNCNCCSTIGWLQQNTKLQHRSAMCIPGTHRHDFTALSITRYDRYLADACCTPTIPPYKGWSWYCCIPCRKNNTIGSLIGFEPRPRLTTAVDALPPYYCCCCCIFCATSFPPLAGTLTNVGTSRAGPFRYWCSNERNWLIALNRYGVVSAVHACGNRRCSVLLQNGCTNALNRCFVARYRSPVSSW